MKDFHPNIWKSKLSFPMNILICLVEVLDILHSQMLYFQCNQNMSERGWKKDVSCLFLKKKKHKPYGV